MTNLPGVVHARVPGLSVVLDLTERGVPVVAYWGRELRHEDPASLEALVAAARGVSGGNAPDDPRGITLVPGEGIGWEGRPGLVGHREAGTMWSPRWTLTEVRLPADARRAVVSSGQVVAECGAGAVTVVAYDGEAALTLTVAIELLAQGLARTRATLTNDHASSEYALDELGIVVPVPLEADEILDTSGRWGKERHAQRRPVVLGCDLREGRHGRTGFDSPDVTFVGRAGFDYAAGEVWGLHVAFSGNHRTWVEKLPTGHQVIGGSELLLPGEVTLAPGAEYATPWLYLVHGSGLDDTAHRVHRWLRSRPQHVRSPRPVTLNVWEAVYFRHDLDELRHLADLAAEIGVERYVLDDGWFHGRRNDWAGLGDWFVDSDVWPEGLGPLADHVHARGMQFGLWFEPEMVNEDSDLARAHPDWLLAARPDATGERLPAPWRHQQVLNLTIRPAWEYIRDRVVALVREYGIDYIKWDHNRDLLEAGDQHGGGRAAVHAQTLAAYALLDAIKAECPGLEIESCSSGGGRIDLEIVQHTDRVWVSDCIDPVERQEIVRNLTQLLPYELMGTHVASAHSHTTGRWSPLSFRGATALFGHFGIEWDIASASPAERAELAEWITFYKEQRALLHSGDVVRAASPDPSVWLHGVVATDASRALFAVVTRERSPLSPRGRIRLPGLEAARRYRVRPLVIGSAPSGLVPAPWFGEGVVLTGEALAQSGLQTPMMHPDQALLVSVEACG